MVYNLIRMFQNMGTSTEQTTWFLKSTAKEWGVGENSQREGIQRLRQK